MTGDSANDIQKKGTKKGNSGRKVPWYERLYVNAKKYNTNKNPRCVKKTVAAKDELDFVLTAVYCPTVGVFFEKTDPYLQCETVENHPSKTGNRSGFGFTPLKRSGKHRKQVSHHTKQVSQHSKQVSQHGGQLSQHDRQLSEHSRQLSQHSRQMSEHSRQMSEHSRQMSEHSRQMSQQSRQMSQHSRQVNQDIMSELEEDTGEEAARRRQMICSSFGIVMSNGGVERRENIHNVKLGIGAYHSPQTNPGYSRTPCGAFYSI